MLKTMWYNWLQLSCYRWLGFNSIDLCCCITEEKTSFIIYHLLKTTSVSTCNTERLNLCKRCIVNNWTHFLQTKEGWVVITYHVCASAGSCWRQFNISYMINIWWRCNICTQSSILPKKGYYTLHWKNEMNRACAANSCLGAVWGPAHGLGSKITVCDRGARDSKWPLHWWLMWGVQEGSPLQPEYHKKCDSKEACTSFFMAFCSTVSTQCSQTASYSCNSCFHGG